MFVGFLVVAMWLLPLPLWLQIVLTACGALHVILKIISACNDD